MLDSFSDLDGISVNQGLFYCVSSTPSSFHLTEHFSGTVDTRLPQLGFHSVHGQNVILQKGKRLIVAKTHCRINIASCLGGRVAKRKESFCKGLAFSNRPVSVNENVCIRLTEVSTSWSGVLRFGVTNVDPETYRNIQVPKFACPDLTSKEGFWAKALPERYSVEGNILHFSITHAGDLCYGVNGVHKGVFLVGINVSLPIWIIIDIYGNSVAVEFVDPSDFRVPRASSTASRIASASNPSHEPTPVEPPTSSTPQIQSATNTTSPNFETLRFHQMTGRHVSLNTMRNMASRCSSEYAQGYVFSERPIRNNEKVVIEIVSVQQLYKGGLAFGVTCCDPSTLRSADLPDDSSDLIEMPQYWVGIKDIALQPRVNTVLSEVKFEKDQGGPRTVLHVDNSLPLYMYFDIYGSTQAIKLRGKKLQIVSLFVFLKNNACFPISLATAKNNVFCDIRSDTGCPSAFANDDQEFCHNLFIVRDEANGTTDAPLPNLLDENYDENSAHPRNRPTLPPRRTLEEAMLRRTVDDLLSDSPPVSMPRPPPLAPRPTPLLGPLPAPPSRPPPPTPTAIASSLSAGGTSSMHNANSVLDSLLGRPSGVSQDLPSSSRSSLPNLQSLSAPSTTRAKSAQLSVGRESSEREEGAQGDDMDECTVCMSARVNSALYKCGHSCMCYDCAMQTYHSSGLCPLCRASILDVIKIFKA
ncbi:unnamed protein product [Strongylus vulgaris]|uniref:RING-type domain-containing protein n=1 Tax=Strongylus vulgaris TaxID=40348 RepID=A0A3P7IMP1_STRVU|nr:unnamed protein product [Strongylus vulgaris]